MPRRFVLVALAATAGACFDFGALSEADDAGASAVDGSGGPAATGAAGGSRGDATTGATDATVAVDAPTSTDGGAGETASGVDATAPWSIQTYAEATGTWGPPLALDQFWGASPNAPPGRGISSVVQFLPFDRLLVFTDDGKLYRRSGGTWLAPQAITAVFPGAPAPAPTTTYHVRDGNGGAAKVGVTMVKNPVAYLYDYSSADVVTFTGSVTMTDQGGQGPPQATGRAEWDFEVYDLSKYLVDATWALFYAGYGNEVYRGDGNGGFIKWPKASFPYFAGKAGSPLALGKTIRAAFHNGSFLYMISE